MSSVRAFVQEDIPQVAALTWRFLHGCSSSPPSAVEDYFRELFFHSPFSEKALPSFVYQNGHGSVVGFLGILRRRMSLHGKPIDFFLSGKQDLAMTDTANHVTQQIWTRLGGSTASLYGMHWSRPLRPAHYAVHAVSRFGRGLLSGAFALGCKPVCKIVDAVAARLPSSPFRQKLPLISEEELTAETLLVCLRDFSESHSLRPEYDTESVTWLLDFMDRMRAHGSLRKVLLRNRGNKIIGWYMYYLRHGGVGQVVQVWASPSSIDAVLDHLAYDAWTHGAIALHGRLEPQLSQKLSGKYCFYFLGNRLLVHSRNPELARQIQSGSAFLTRLDGEWCLRFGTPERATRRELARYRSDAKDLVRPSQHVKHDFETSASDSAAEANTA